MRNPLDRRSFLRIAGPSLSIGALYGAFALARLGTAMIMDSSSGWSPRRVLAAEQSQVIEIRAKKYEFSPSAVTLKRGAPVALRPSSEHRSHGFFATPLGIDAATEPGQSTDIAITPAVTGEYAVICDHYCGLDHGSMKMTVTEFSNRLMQLSLAASGE